MKRRKQEMRLFKQSVANMFFLLMATFNFTFTWRLWNNKWSFYLATIIPWMFSHASNG